MVHELLGIQNGRVDLSLVPDIRPELKVRLRGVNAHRRPLVEITVFSSHHRKLH